MCQALCQASSKRTLPLKVHASGRRTRAGGWQRALGTWCREGQTDFMGLGVRGGELSQGLAEQGLEVEVTCALFLPRWWLTSKKWCQEQTLPAFPQGPSSRPLAQFLPLQEPWLLALCTSSSGPASLLPLFLKITQSYPDPWMLVTSFPCLDGKTDAQMGSLSVTCQNSVGRVRTKFCALDTKVEMNE